MTERSELDTERSRLGSTAVESRRDEYLTRFESWVVEYREAASRTLDIYTRVSHKTDKRILPTAGQEARCRERVERTGAELGAGVHRPRAERMEPEGAASGLGSPDGRGWRAGESRMAWSCSTCRGSRGGRRMANGLLRPLSAGCQYLMTGRSMT